MNQILHSHLPRPTNPRSSAARGGRDRSTARPCARLRAGSLIHVEFPPGRSQVAKGAPGLRRSANTAFSARFAGCRFAFRPHAVRHRTGGVRFRTGAFESEHPDSSRNATSNRSSHSEPIPVTASGDDRLGDRFRTIRASLVRAVPRNSARDGSFFAPFGLVRVVPLCRFQEAPVKALPEKERSTWASTESL